MYPLTVRRTLRIVATLLLEILPHVLCTFRMSATAPVNPVEANGILSLHCQVWDLPKNNEVRIFRTIQNRDTERISLDEVVIVEDERVFLAKRQVDGGSFVYFMSVIDVTREDGGEYMCKAFNTSAGNVREIGAKSVHLGIVYFPSESDPVCSLSREGFEFYAGTQVTLKCASEAANPTVDLKWTRTSDSEGVYSTEQTHQGSSTYSELSVTLQKHHSGAIFLCTLTSKAFPGKLATCHIGPLQVISNPNDITTDIPDKISGSQPGVLNTVVIDTAADYSGTGVRGGGKPTDCNTVCASSTAVFQWIVTTAVAAGMALIFFVIGIVLVIKYNTIRTVSRRAEFVSNRTTSERIYSELEQKRQDNTSYMYLQCKGPSNNDILVRDMPRGHYDGNQNMGKN